MRDILLRARALVEKPLERRGFLRRAHLRLPDFLGIGAQKAGTTWLHEQLRAHPAIHLPARKELHYFDDNFHRPLRWYAAHFADAGARRAGEITPAYAILDDARLAYVAAVMPRVRAIFLMRDPVERAWSQAVMTLVEQAAREPSTVTEAEFTSFLRSPAVRLRGGFTRTIDAWHRHFPKDQLLLGFHDELRADPEALLARVTDFLGVDPLPRDPLRGRIVFRGIGMPMPDAIRALLVRDLADEMRALADRFGGHAEEWRRRWLG